MNDLALLEQKPLVDSFLAQGPRPLSAFSFISIFAWCDFFDFEIKKINDSLCIFAEDGSGCFLYLPPLGRWDAATIQEAFSHMTHGQPIRPVNRIENIPENSLSVFQDPEYNQYIKPAEYVYRKEDLIALKGNAYKSQRHDCNHFSSRHAGCSFEAYTDDDWGACMDLYSRWARQRAAASSDEIYKTMLLENFRVHSRLLKYWHPLDLVVRVLKQEGCVLGYTLGYALDKTTFCVYAEVTDPQAVGASASIFQRFCADEGLNNFELINTMDDFAMPRVAAAKQAYHPLAKISSYTISIKAKK